MNKKSAMLACLAAVLLVSMMPSDAHAAGGGLDFPIIDAIICPLLGYFKSKFAVLVALLIVVATIIGKMLGWIKDWSDALMIAVGLGLINVVPGLIMSVTGTGGLCPGVL